MEKAEVQGKAAFLSHAKAYVRPVLLGIAAGAAAAGAVLCAAAAVLGALHTTGDSIPAAAIVVAAVGGLCAGFVSAKARKKRGLLTGGFSALMLAVILLAVSWAMSGPPDAAVLSRMAVITAAGMVGGVLGVGQKGKSY
mgnify:CR=1 FL=1